MAFKWTGGMVTAAVAVLVYLQGYHTDAEAQQLWEQHAQAEACRTVAQLKAEIREREAQLQFDNSLSPEDREWLMQQIQQIKDDIARYDPEGIC